MCTGIKLIDMKWNNYKFRSSGVGNIVSKSGKLTQGVKTYVAQKRLEKLKDFRIEITSKYFEKGNLTEQAGLAMLNRCLYPGTFLHKNTKSESNDYITGTCDAITPDGIVYDIKNAWDWETFRKAELTHNYEWQLKAYCWLYGKPHGRLMYCLNDMPDEMIDDEERKLFYAKKFPPIDHPEYDEARAELERRYKYDNYSDWERFKIWDVPLLPGDIDRIKSAVEAAREYMAQLDEEEKERILINKSLVYNE